LLFEEDNLIVTILILDRVMLGTWNVNGKKPGEPLEAWLLNDDQPAPDIYAIGYV
jgi:hypothetical protein